uniref:Unc-119 lipid binding chaperone B homolog 2 n=1 Tax=Sinocyclocheilus grahami TaxID=75366 RepID=A0A672QZT1_SINGR
MDSEGVKEQQSEEEMEQEMSCEKDEDSEPEEEDEADEDEEEMAEIMDRGVLRDTEVWNGFISGGGLAAEEEVLLDWKPGDSVTPQYVLMLPGYTDDYLCSPEDNVYNISFSRFKIRDLEGGSVILDLKRHCPTAIKDIIELDAGRFIQYHFIPAFLNLREIGATLEFTVGGKAVNKFRLIESNYFNVYIISMCIVCNVDQINVRNVFKGQ